MPRFSRISLKDKVFCVFDFLLNNWHMFYPHLIVFFLTEAVILSVSYFFLRP